MDIMSDELTHLIIQNSPDIYNLFAMSLDFDIDTYS